MTVTEIRSILNATMLCGEGCEQREIFTACGSDMMSDVLAFVKEQGALLTGLVNPQVVRTAEMMDMKCIVFVRGKTPDADIIELARSRDMCVMCTKLEMFSACGLLYKNGLRGSSHE